MLLCMMCALAAAADGGTSALPRLSSPDGREVRDIVLLKGRTVDIVSDQAAVWSSLPEGVLEIKDVGNGRVQVTALRDWFDETPSREPTAKVRACVGENCVGFNVTCLIDANGTWNSRMAGKWLGIFDHSEDRVLKFVQNGRNIDFEPDPGKPCKLRLEGNRVRLVSGGGVLKVFSGMLNDRRSGGGSFDSVPGFSGKWTAIRQ